MTNHAALRELAPCICGAVVDQQECPYPTAGYTNAQGRRLYKVTCSDPECGWSCVGFGMDGARKAWNTRGQLSTAASDGGADPAFWVLPLLVNNCKGLHPVVNMHKVTVATERTETHTLPLYTHPPEVARDAVDLGDGYTAYRSGEIRNIDGQALQPFLRNGYPTVFIWRESKSQQIAVHRVIAQAFCTKQDESQDQVNHRDGDITNNSAQNLEWCTAQENSVHGKRILHRQCRPVRGTRLDDGSVVEFSSIVQASEAGFKPANIDKVIKGIRSQHAGYFWEYADEEPALRRDAFRYRKLRDWFIRGGQRAEIAPIGHIKLTTPDEVDSAMDAISGAAGEKDRA